jgi:hypothetical protein
MDLVLEFTIAINGQARVVSGVGNAARAVAKASANGDKVS